MSGESLYAVANFVRSPRFQSATCLSKFARISAAADEVVWPKAPAGALHRATTRTAVMNRCEIKVYLLSVGVKRFYFAALSDFRNLPRQRSKRPPQRRDIFLEVPATYAFRCVLRPFAPPRRAPRAHGREPLSAQLYLPQDIHSLRLRWLQGPDAHRHHLLRSQVAQHSSPRSQSVPMAHGAPAARRPLRDRRNAAAPTGCGSRRTCTSSRPFRRLAPTLALASPSPTITRYGRYAGAFDQAACRPPADDRHSCDTAASRRTESPVAPPHL